MSEHTQTPWGYQSHDFRGNQLEFDFCIIGDVQECEDGDGMTSVGIGRVFGNATAGDIPLANAKLICRAVNAHAALLACVERCHARLSALAEGHPGTGKPWSADYLVSELQSLADECRRALPGEG